MPPSTYHDVIIIGLGAVGSAAAYHLSKAGAKVLGLERFTHPGHMFGSSHGLSRITRLAYREGSEYVPLLRRSYKLFLELQEESNTQLYLKTGMLEVGPAAATGTAVKSAQDHGLTYEVLTGSEVNTRFSGYHIPAHWQGMFQHEAGMLIPEACIKAHCDGAVAAGADLRWNQKVTRWEAERHGSGGVTVCLDNGTEVAAGQLLLAAGSWMSDLLPQAKDLLQPVRQVVGWFEVSNPSLFTPENFPVFIVDPAGSEEEAQHDPTAQTLVPDSTHTEQALASGSSSNCTSQTELDCKTREPKDGNPPFDIAHAAWYGFPEWGSQRGFKIGLYNHLGEVVHPDNVNRSVTAADEEALRYAVRRYFPAADGPLLHHSTCLFTNTPDGHFIIDRHPAYDQVMICSACSGHGFKMSSGIGQLLAQEMLAKDRNTGFDELALHRLNPQRSGHDSFIKACLQL